jgi:hypothetical protein
VSFVIDCKLHASVHVFDRQQWALFGLSPFKPVSVPETTQSLVANREACLVSYDSRKVCIRYRTVLESQCYQTICYLGSDLLVRAHRVAQLLALAPGGDCIMDPTKTGVSRVGNLPCWPAKQKVTVDIVVHFGGRFGDSSEGHVGKCKWQFPEI